MKSIALLVLTLLTLTVEPIFGQQDSLSAWSQKPEVNIIGFTDLSYVYDFNEPSVPHRQPFLFNHNRHNSFDLNLGLVKLQVDHEKFHVNAGLHTGTYSSDNYAAEPHLLKNVFEANVGFSLNKQNSLWIQVGVLPSHIGFESAISSDNTTLTRSLLAENSPYFLTGSKVTYRPNEKWELAGLLVNGWQRIQPLKGNSMPSFGTQVNFKPDDETILNWSSFIGTDDPDSTRRIRIFNNFYGQFNLHPKLNLIAGIDVGVQQRSKNSRAYSLWLSPVLIAQYQFVKSLKTSLRFEYYKDGDGVIIKSINNHDFEAFGGSVNLDYAPTANILFRIEGRWLGSKQEIFPFNSGFTANNFIIGSSFAFKLVENVNRRLLN